MLQLLCVVLLSFVTLSTQQNIGKFVIVSDLHYAPEAPPNDIQYGEDSPFGLINSTVYAIGAIQDQLDFILITGDLTSHTLADKATDDAVPYINQVLGGLSTSFSTVFGSRGNPFLSSPVICLGNNDLYPKYAAPGSTPGWFTSFAAQWPGINSNADAQQSFLINGSYVIDVPTGGAGFVRVISLHTNYWSISNKFTTNDEDPGGVLAFLSNALATAQNQSVKVYVMGHVAPGIDHYGHGSQWHERFVVAYTNIVIPYLGNTILAQFYGHEHVSLYRLIGDYTAVVMEQFKSATDVLAPPASAGPIRLHSSISPVYDNNPCFREYTYNRDTLELLDYAEWYLDVSVNNSQWQQQFTSVKSLYSMQAITTTDYCSLTEKMYSDSTLFGTYYNNSFSFASDESACTGQCPMEYLCNTQWLLSDDYGICVSQGIRLPCAGGPVTTSTSTSSGSRCGTPASMGWMLFVVVISAMTLVL